MNTSSSTLSPPLISREPNEKIPNSVDKSTFLHDLNRSMASSSQDAAPSSSRPATAAPSGENPSPSTSATAPAMVSGEIFKLRKIAFRRGPREVRVSSRDATVPCGSDLRVLSASRCGSQLEFDPASQSKSNSTFVHVLSYIELRI